MSRLQLIDVSKQYPGVKANDAVSLSVEPGEIHAVLGENGAGKSTLMKVIYGAVQPDAGQILWNGARVRVTSPDVARKLGIAMVFQHFSLFESLTVAENVWLGLDTREPLRSIATRVAEVAAEYGLDLAPERPVHSLSVGEKQRVEIVRALLTDPQLLILDEPTSVLTPQAVRKLFGVLRRLSAAGCSILYISHKLDEIRELCDRCTVLRGGRVVGEVVPSQESNASLSRLMIGTEHPRAEPRASHPGNTLLEVNNLSLTTHREFGTSLWNINLAVRGGEIVGVAGVSGNGQKELLAALSGEEPDTPRGSVRLMGKDVAGYSPARRRSLGVRFVPEERLGRGAVPMLSLAANTLLTRTEPLMTLGFFAPSRLARMARNLISNFGVKARGPEAAAKSLSGGNLQKFIVGREIDADPKLLLLSQPTWGVDVGAAARIRAEVLTLRARGVGVLLVSEELDELLELSDVLVVIAGGRLSPPIARHEASIEQLGEWMSGLFDHTPSAVAGAEVGLV
jgi:general nucleoside transport system ATP-binding protein